ncbi:Arginase/deacetylase [Cadophora sp. DSE1049]|nr:Arginase/deacetylase [Cadophora sp. DSE1049]
MVSSNKINIITAPADVGSVFPGKSRAPAALQSAGLVNKLTNLGYDVSIYDALPDGPAGWSESDIEPNGARNEVAAVAVCHAVKNTIAFALTNSASDEEIPFQLILGGECLICPAILSALTHHMPTKRIGLLYVDADCDLTYPNEPGSTGNVAGMTFTHLTLRPGALESMKTFSKPDGSGVVDSSNAVLFGLNSSSPANKRDHLGYLFNENYRVITSSAVAVDAAGRAKEALSWLEERVDYILVHLDVDVIDPGLFPLGNVPNWTGVKFPEIMTAMRISLESEKAVGFTIAEVNPDHDHGLRMTERLVDEVVAGLKVRMK